MKTVEENKNDNQFDSLTEIKSIIDQLNATAQKPVEEVVVQKTNLLTFKNFFLLTFAGIPISYTLSLIAVFVLKLFDFSSLNIGWFIDNQIVIQSSIAGGVYFLFIIMSLLTLTIRKGKSAKTTPQESTSNENELSKEKLIDNLNYLMEKVSPNDWIKLLKYHASYFRFCARMKKKFNINGADLSNVDVIFLNELFTFNFVESGLQNLKFKEVDLSFLNLVGKDYSGSTFEKCKFDKAYFERSNLKNVKFKMCLFDNVNFSKANLENTSFEKSKLGHSNFNKAKLNNASFKTTDLQFAKFDQSDMCGTDFTNAKNISNATFVDAEWDDNTIIDKEQVFISLSRESEMN